MPWNEVLARNSVGLGFKSMCRDEHGQPPAHYDDSGRNPIGGDIVYHYDTSPTGTDRLPSEATLPIVAGVASADFAPTTPISTPSLPSSRNRRRKIKSQRCAQLDPVFPQQESPGEAQVGEKVQLE
jgi:hypothetical protein